MKRLLAVLSSCIFATACSQESAESSLNATTFVGRHAQTIILGDVDNVESIKVNSETGDVLALSSKSRKLTLLSSQSGLTETRSVLIDDATDEGETTNFAISPNEQWAAVTRTVIAQDSAGTVQACGGELFIVDVENSERFGDVLAKIEIGPMPDSVAIAQDGTILVGNERDVVWGKCADVANVAPPSISVLRFDSAASQVTEISRVELRIDREPEGIAITDDGKVAIALQDTHEVAQTTLQKLIDGEAQGISYVTLPQNQIGQDAWPDGMTHFALAGAEYFAIAGEGNDVVYVVDEQNTIVKTLEVNAAMIPHEFPVDGTWGPLFRPDSITSFTWNDQTYVACSLKASGAVAIWQVGSMDEAWRFSVTKVGMANELGAASESVVQTEGIAADGARGFVVTANEKESSISLVLPE